MRPLLRPRQAMDEIAAMPGVDLVFSKGMDMQEMADRIRVLHEARDRKKEDCDCAAAAGRR
eukprot:2063921-Prymnesium_polylepis.2